MRFPRDRYRVIRLMALLLIAVALAMPTTLWSKKHNEADAKLVGHLGFEGEILVDMALTEGGGRRYLYVLHSHNEGVSIVDVTSPSQPKLLGTTFWPEGAELGGLTFMGDYAVGDDTSVSRAHSRLSEAKVVTSLAHVKRAIFNEGLVYVLTDTEVWIVGVPSAV